LRVGTIIEGQLLAAFMLLAKFCQNEKLQIQNSKFFFFSQFSVDKSEGKKSKNCHIHIFHFQLVAKHIR
jgi:hypothetical protein